MLRKPHRVIPTLGLMVQPGSVRAFSSPADSYSRHINDPETQAQTYEGFATRIVWASILHPFDLLATRMMTESAPEVKDACGCPLVAWFCDAFIVGCSSSDVGSCNFP